MAHILYLGDSYIGSTSAHRAASLVRLGHHVVIKDISLLLRKKYGLLYFEPLHYRTGYKLLQIFVVIILRKIIKTQLKPDLIWINSGELFGPLCLKTLRTFDCPIVVYCNDDPTGGRDGNRFSSMVKAIPNYDACIVVRNINIDEFLAYGAKKVIKITMSYDEVTHKPFLSKSLISDKYKSDVVFVGTWMRNENRDLFLLDLIKFGVPVSIWGDRWQKSQYWETLKYFHRGGALSGRDYVSAIQGAKICLGLLSKGNRDQYTQRTFEIPYAGGLLCAERTLEHLAFYEEGKEAVFWSNARECADICKKLLSDDSLRESIRLNGVNKVKLLKVGNQDICNIILNKINIIN